MWLMNGTNLIGGEPVGTNPGPSWHRSKAPATSTAMARDDILWQDDNGTAGDLADERHEPDRRRPCRDEPGASWHVEGSGDYNGDGKSDILWQNTDGTPAIWFMNGTNVISGGVVGAGNPGAEWDVIA